MVRIVPTDPAAALAGQQATPAEIQAIRVQHGFDRPLHEQFYFYLRDLAQGNLGTSLYSHRPVADEVMQRLPATIELTLFALFLAAAMGIPLGVLAAANHNRWFDQATRIATVCGLAIASFWFALMLQLLFSLEWQLLPLSGRISSVADKAPPFYTGLYLVDSLIAGRLDTFVDALRHLILPATTLAFGAMATITRLTRSGVLDVLEMDYVAYERAVGYPRFALLAKYVLRNALLVTVTQIGLLFGGLLSGAVVIEAIFQWPGLGSYAIWSIQASDYKAIMAVVLVIGVIYALVNIGVDVLHAWIDPRLRERRR
jgi:peptide/nickel transport system permease protein